MGLINKKVTTLDNGLEVSNTYISIECLKIEKNVSVESVTYTIYNRAMEHISREKKYEGKPKINSLSVNFHLEELPSTFEELYTKAYSEIKIFYPDLSDVTE